MLVNSIKIPVFDYNKQLKEPVLRTFGASKDTISLKSIVRVGKLPDDINVNLENICENTEGVVEVNNVGYLAQVFKYKSPSSGRIYAIKKIWPEHLAKHVTSDPIGQLRSEAQIYERLKGAPNIPKFYFYKGDFSNTPKALANNYLVMQWVEGKQASSSGACYDTKLVDKGKLEKLYNLLLEFDKRGVLHNDLWAGNILFTKNDVGIIDFNRSQFFNPLKLSEGSNLDSFKERFINAHLAYTYKNSGVDALVDLYKITQLLEANFLEKKAKFFKSNGLNSDASRLLKQAKEMRQNAKNKDITEQNALSKVFETNLRYAKIYAKYFEFGDDEALEYYFRLKELSSDNPNYSANITVINLLKDLMKLKNPEDALGKCHKIKELLLDETIYSEDEKQEVYYQKFSKFTDISANVLSSLLNDDKQQAKEILDLNKDFFRQTKRMMPYYSKLYSLAWTENI